MGILYDEQKRDLKYGRVATLVGLILVSLIAATMAGCPRYNVWRQGLIGEASLRRAQQDRQIAVLEAQAKYDSSKLFAKAEVERARGVKEANVIIADSLTGHPEYLQYLMIQAFEHVAAVPGGGSQVIYVPTEAMMPITEAYRLNAADRKRAVTRALMEDASRNAEEK